jgi:hypothetical protein
MIRPKNLDMDKINKLFNENFIFDKEELNKGCTRFIITPRRESLPIIKGVKNAG